MIRRSLLLYMHYYTKALVRKEELRKPDQKTHYPEGGQVSAARLQRDESHANKLLISSCYRAEMQLRLQSCPSFDKIIISGIYKVYFLLLPQERENNKR